MGTWGFGFGFGLGFFFFHIIRNSEVASLGRVQQVKTQPPSDVLLCHPDQMAFMVMTERGLLYLQTSRGGEPRAKGLFSRLFFSRD